MKKKIIIILFFLILILAIIFIVKNCKNNSKLNFSVEKIDNPEYYLLMKNNKYGVINKKGDIIVPPTYDIVEIPNSSKPVFICKSNYDSNTKKYQSQVLNDKKEQILYQYYTVESIKLNNVENDSGNYEKSALKYESEGKYGLIDFNGNKITKPIYDSIDGFNYREGILLVKKSDKYGIINIKGGIIIKPKYDEILCDQYYKDNDGYSKSGYIVGKKTKDGMRYGFIDGVKRKQILKNKFNDIYRITDKKDDKYVYLVAFKDGKAGVYKNKKQIIKNEYEDILYNANSDLLTLQKSSKQGIAKFDGTIIIPIEYENIFFAGEFINAQNGENIKVFDFNGKEQSSEYISKQNVKNGDFSIVSTLQDKYKLINNKTNKIIDDNYQYLQYLFGKYFSVSKNDKYGVIDSDGNTVIDFKYNSMQLIDNSNILKAIDDNENTEIFDNNLKSILKLKNANIYFEDSYFKIYYDNNIVYLDKNGNKLKNTDLFSNNNIYTFTDDNGKWGLKNKNGDIIVDAKYEFATELNKYGFAGIKLDNKWGVIDSTGKIIQDPIYGFDENLLPDFIGKYYKVDLGYGDPYYSEKGE